MPISGRTRLFGLLGDPVAHSLSPAMHNAALAELGIDGVYLPFPCQAKDLKSALSGLAAVGVGGLNVTIPHKQAVIAHLGQVDPAAAAIGAVNTLDWDPTAGFWRGRNTDIEGFVTPLIGLQKFTQALILGSGGAARAAIQGCVQLGIPDIVVVGRRTQNLLTLQAIWPSLRIRLWDQLKDQLPTADLVVNATPIGMTGHGFEDSPLSVDQIKLAPRQALFYDLIYTPRPTVLLKQASGLGYGTQDGLEMLIRQGSSALAGWLDFEAGIPDTAIDKMRQAAFAQLQGLNQG